MQRLPVRKCPTSVPCRAYAQRAPQTKVRDPPRPQSFRYRGESKGHGPDLPLIAITKTMVDILANSKDVPMRHGYMRVRDLLTHALMRSVNFKILETIVERDVTQRFHLRMDPKMVAENLVPDAWWISWNQKPAVSELAIDLEPIFSARSMPTIIHGTTLSAWQIIEKHGIHRMGRNYIHCAREYKEKGVISGIRQASRILIYLNVKRMLDDGIKLYLSKNDLVVLTPGDEDGYIKPKYFHRVEKASRTIKEIPLDRDP
ncbi:hypothetical protein BDZ89DRAFT_1055626 [Hymenopellis radicata]|nr:hypothetical protein BDZ89DRAFT_1055626 [Hymenopellis radicata]